MQKEYFVIKPKVNIFLDVGIKYAIYRIIFEGMPQENEAIPLSGFIVVFYSSSTALNKTIGCKRNL